MRSHEEQAGVAEPKRGRAIALVATGALLLSGCAVYGHPYLHNTSDVPCNGRKTKADFSDTVSKILFFARQKDGGIFVVTVDRETTNVYDFHTAVSRSSGMRVEQIGKVVIDGSANPDYSVRVDTTIWDVDVRPDEPSVVIWGDC